MKTHPEFYAWLFLLVGFAFFLALGLILYHFKSLSLWVREWCALLSEIYHGTGQRWQDHG